MSNQSLFTKKVIIFTLLNINYKKYFAELDTFSQLYVVEKCLIQMEPT